MAEALSAADAKVLVHGDDEIALIDVREPGQFGEGHPLFAVPCPYSRLEVDFPRLVPRLGTRIILLDDGDGVADRAAARLDGLGYDAVSVLHGGIRAWRDAGYSIYKGVNVPSKLLGEFVEHHHAPQCITATTLAEWQRSGTDFHFFDTRPPNEYAKMRVPGAVCLPNGELAHRIGAAVQNESETVLITCAGRTRGLIGAAGLKLAGVRNPVFALENGTQGWALAGQDLERGNTADTYPTLDEVALQSSRERAQALCRNDGIELIGAATIETMLAEPGATTHVVDVRSEAEATSDRIPCAVHALGGQLVQSTDQWIGTRRSRVVLVDDTGLRAALAAYWLKRLGYRTFVHVIGPETYSIRHRIGTTQAIRPCRRVSAREAYDATNSDDAVLLDLRHSSEYRERHSEGAVWAIRPLLDERYNLEGRMVYLFCDDQDRAGLAALDITEAGATSVAVVDGGISAWATAGLPVVDRDETLKPDDAIDFLRFVHDRHDGNLEASRTYLAWEQGLIDQTDELERAEFHL